MFRKFIMILFVVSIFAGCASSMAGKPRMITKEIKKSNGESFKSVEIEIDHANIRIDKVEIIFDKNNTESFRISGYVSRFAISSWNRSVVIEFIDKDGNIISKKEGDVRFGRLRSDRLRPSKFVVMEPYSEQILKFKVALK